jgi:hypothetical protein
MLNTYLLCGKNPFRCALVPGMSSNGEPLYEWWGGMDPATDKGSNPIIL